MRGNGRGRPLGKSELWSYFSQFVDQSTFKQTSLRGSVRSLQRRFPIDDIVLRSGDIRDQVAKFCEIAPKFDVFSRQFSGEGPPKFLTEFYKSRSTSNMWQSLVTIGQRT